MQNGSRAHLNLLSYSQINGVVYYNIQIHLHGQVYCWEQRYSQLKQVCRQFPTANVKFPPKNSVRHVLSQITNSEWFLLERFNFMKEYFQSVSSNAQLRFNRAFLQIYRSLQETNKTNTPTKDHQKAPVIKGRKLSMKSHNNDQMYIIV